MRPVSVLSRDREDGGKGERCKHDAEETSRRLMSWEGVTSWTEVTHARALFQIAKMQVMQSCKFAHVVLSSTCKLQVTTFKLQVANFNFKLKKCSQWRRKRCSNVIESAKNRTFRRLSRQNKARQIWATTGI